MIRGFLIDFGGTIDTPGIHWFRVFQRAYGLCSCLVAEEQLRQAYVHAERTLGRERIIMPDFTFRKTIETKVRLQLDDLGLSDDFVTPITDHCYDYVCNHIESVSKPVLTLFAERYPLALVTNFYGNMQVVLQEFGMSGLFHCVTESAVCGVRKPNPEIFSIAAQSLGLSPEETCMVGDSLDKDIVPAASVGCRTVWLHNTSTNSSWTDTSVEQHLIPSETVEIHSIQELTQLQTI